MGMLSYDPTVYVCIILKTDFKAKDTDHVYSPIESYWIYAEGRKCIDTENQDIAILVLNSTFDLITYIWPVQYLYNLQMPVKGRIELIAAFGVGLL